MLATAAGYEFDVDRGPDWLWIRIRSVETGSSPAASLAEEAQGTGRETLHLPRRARVAPGSRTEQPAHRGTGGTRSATSKSTTACCGFAGSRRRAVRCWRCAVWMTSASRMKRARRPFSAVALRACPDSAAEDPQLTLSITNKLPVRWRSLGRPPHGGSLPGPFAFEKTSLPCREASRGLRWSRNAAFWGRCRDFAL